MPEFWSWRQRLRYWLIRGKDVLINWTRDWWKIVKGGDCFDCCDRCLQMCPECNECHSDDPFMPYTHTGLYCPHKGVTSPEGEAHKRDGLTDYQKQTFDSLVGL